MKSKKTDLLLIGVFLMIGLGMALFLFLGRKNGETVQVRVDGEVVAEYRLDEDQTQVIAGYESGTNLLVIRDGKAWVEEASCPDGLCINMGQISAVGQSVVCLPNRVVVEVIDPEGTAEDPGVDVIAR